MFWIVASFLGLMAFAVMLGQFSVWFTLLKFALMLALLVIAVMGIALLRRSLKAKSSPQIGRLGSVESQQDAAKSPR